MSDVAPSAGVPSDPVVLPVAERRVVPWLNGGGVSAEVVLRPAGPAGNDFDWRLSIATVDGDGGFSAYPGIDRVLMPISPEGLDLVHDGRLVALDQFEAHRFPGESAVSSANVTRPTLDLNLMTRRERCTGTLESVEVSGRWSAGAGANEEIVLVVLDGRLRLGERVLNPQDAVLVENRGEVAVQGTARVALVRVVTPR